MSAALVACVRCARWECQTREAGVLPARVSLPSHMVLATRTARKAKQVWRITAKELFLNFEQGRTHTILGTSCPGHGPNGRPRLRATFAQENNTASSPRGDTKPTLGLSKKCTRVGQEVAPATQAATRECHRTPAKNVASQCPENERREVRQEVRREARREARQEARREEGGRGGARC